MATPKPKPHTYRIPRAHAVASKMKPGDQMTSRMQMMEPDDDDETYPMQEVESSPYTAPATAKPKQKAKTAAEALRRRRETPIT